MHTRKVLMTAMVLGWLPAGTQVFAQVINTWTEQGPGPILKDSNTLLLPDNPVAGAINAIVPSPTSSDVVFAGTVSGGIWTTSNATASTPTWTPLTDTQLRALPIKSLAISPVDSRILFAGTGSTSSFGPVPSGNDNGSGGIGVARSIDGGNNWTVQAGDKFTGRVITSIVPTTLDSGRIVLASTWPDDGGVYRSTDTGATFIRISGNSASRLPDAGVTSLIADPADPRRFYAGVPGGGAGQLGDVYRSDDGGVTWKTTGLPVGSASLRILLTIHNDPVNNVVYAATITKNVFTGVFRSINQGGWRNLGLPNPPIYSAGDGEGGQGGLHGAIAADPSNPDVVFISGDAQSETKKGDFNTTPRIANANGCTAYYGNVFRYTGTRWENIVCSGAKGTAPKADSRFMTFDKNGDLLQANDGGIARLVKPNDRATRNRVAVDGNISSAEFHSISYDPVSNIVLGGAQDNGTAFQSSSGAFSWNQEDGGDGGVVGVDGDQKAHFGTSIRYSSSQQLGGFNRTEWYASNTQKGSWQYLGLNIVEGSGKGQTLSNFEATQNKTIPFYPPFALNALIPSRMLILSNYIYESTNKGDSLSNLGPLKEPPSSYGRPIAYGGSEDRILLPGLFYVGNGNEIYFRLTDKIEPKKLLGYHGDKVVTISINPKNFRQVYVCDSKNKIWGSSNAGVTWIDLTGNLGAATAQVTTIGIFSRDGTIRNTTLYAGGFGVFQLGKPSTAGGQWTPVTGIGGNIIPPALVLDLHYDYSKGILVAGTLGRGAWIFGPAAVPAIASIQPRITDNLSNASFSQTSWPPMARTTRPVVRPTVRLTP